LAGDVVLGADFFADLVEGFAEALLGFFKAPLHAFHQAVVVELVLEIGDLLFEGDDSGFEVELGGGGHGRSFLLGGIVTN
jgi:hypothetical protein